MKVAYVNHTYPQLTQTFVYREVRALRALGLDDDAAVRWVRNALQVRRD